MRGGDAPGARFNASVYRGRLPADLDMSWNVHLKTTAGLTYFLRLAASALNEEPRCDLGLRGGGQFRVIDGSVVIRSAGS